MPLKPLEVAHFSADFLDHLGNSGFRLYFSGLFRPFEEQPAPAHGDLEAAEGGGRLPGGHLGRSYQVTADTPLDLEI